RVWVGADRTGEGRTEGRGKKERMGRREDAAERCLSEEPAYLPAPWPPRLLAYPGLNVDVTAAGHPRTNGGGRGAGVDGEGAAGPGRLSAGRCVSALGMSGGGAFRRRLPPGGGDPHRGGPPLSVPLYRSPVPARPSGAGRHRGLPPSGQSVMRSD